MNTMLAERNGAQAIEEAIENVLIQGDLSKMSAAEKVAYYMRVCESLGLNPYTKPFAYLKLQGTETLYARKDATDQLRKINEVSIVSLTNEMIGDLYVVTATARTPNGRQDSDVGAVPLTGLKGADLANAMLKAVTKAKRRVTLSICGLGMTDESEVESIPGARVVDVSTGEVTEPAPPEGEQKMVTSAKGKLMQRYASLLEEAAALEIDIGPWRVELPVPEADLTTLGKQLVAEINRVRDAQQEPEAF